jgi:hypothetical protein
MGGKIVQSEAESKYILTPGFDENVRGLADEVGASSGLHVNTAAHRVEKAALEMLYDGDQRENINPWLSSSSIPTALRRLLINDGLLTVRQIDPHNFARYNPDVPQFGSF